MNHDTALPLVRVLAAVINRDGHFLICQRPAHKRHGGLWEFPGGKVEKGETDLQAAHRELMEELNVKVTEVGSVDFSIRDVGSPFVIEFMQVRIDGEPQCIEHSALAWAKPDDLTTYDLAPSDLQFAIHLAHSRSPR
jgi:mutator protein MutT